MVLIGDLGRRLGEHEAADVLHTIVADSQRYEVFLPVNIDRANLMVGAGGGG
jgi:primosomal protein N'